MEGIMEEATGRWLMPLMDEAERQGMELSEKHRLMAQARVPVPEENRPLLDLYSKELPPGSATTEIDWIWYGNLLRERLGWLGYSFEPGVATEEADPDRFRIRRLRWHACLLANYFMVTPPNAFDEDRLERLVHHGHDPGEFVPVLLALLRAALRGGDWSTSNLDARFEVWRNPEWPTMP